jgi:sensor histidine kinase regulating citrate/malate metabolism
MINKFRTATAADENTLSEMGLVSTKKLVETMNGTFTYYGDDKIGNYFKIEFPSTQ